MRFRLGFILLLIMAALAVAPRAAQAAESYDSCTGYITALPVTITTPGTWCLKQNLSTANTSGNAITVSSSDVTLDCNNFKLDGSGAGMSTKRVGIRAAGRLNTTIRHCSVRGFYIGAYLTGTGGGHVIEDNHFNGNTYTALWIEGDGAVVRRNHLIDTGGSTAVTNAYGVFTRYTVDVLDNHITGVFTAAGSAGTAIGIYTDANLGGSISNNRVRAVLKSAAGSARGIFNSASGRITLASNDVVGDASSGSIGLRCANDGGRAKNNVINGFATAIAGCGSAGSNDANP